MSVKRTVATLVALVVPAWLLLAAPTALAKGMIQARLDTGIPKAAPPGSSVTIAGTLGMLEGDTWLPVAPGALFVRLVGSGGGDVTEVPATIDANGHFKARLAVPNGGIRDVWIGADDSCIGPTCTHASQQLFQISGVGGTPVVVPGSDLTATIDPLPPLGPPYSEVEVTVRLALKPGVALADRVLPGSLLVRAADPRTGLATYVDATPIGQGVYRATVPLPSSGALTFEAGTASHDRIALDTVLARLPSPLVLPGSAGVGAQPAGQGGSPSARDASTTPPSTTAEAPLALAALAGLATVVIGLGLSRRGARRRPAHG